MRNNLSLFEMPKPKPVLSRSVRRFLDAPRTARLATTGKDGYPHLVPIWFARVGDELIFGSDRDERKVWNARANPKAAVVIGGEPDRDDAGYMIQGELCIEDTPDRRLVRALVYRYENGADAERRLNEWTGSDMVILRLNPRRVIRVW